MRDMITTHLVEYKIVKEIFDRPYLVDCKAITAIMKHTKKATICGGD